MHEDSLELTTTNPKGKRKPFLPFISNDIVPEPVTLDPGKAFYLSVNLAIGIGSCPFKEPGIYRIDAGHQSAIGSTAAGNMQMQINPYTQLINEYADCIVELPIN